MSFLRCFFVTSTLAFNLLAVSATDADVLFEEDFDSQPDFTSTMHTTDKAQRAREGFTLPQNWDSLYQDTAWSPETGFPNNHASLEILSNNSDKAYGGQGKSAVMWRESYSLGWKNWASDSQLIKLFDTQHKQLYVEFYIRFSTNFYGRDHASNFASKIFRLASWDGQGDEFSGFQGALGPIYLWDYKRDDYGVRNYHSFRGGPWGENYNLNGAYPKERSLNYGSSTKGQAEGGGDPKLIDQVNGGYLVDESSVIGHNQVFGPGPEWTKVAFFVRMNSAPGVADGILRQWVNDQRIVNSESIPWVQESASGKMVGWNLLAIGGNDYFQPFPNEDRFEDWYAIDNLVVRDVVPKTLSGPSVTKNAPNPPSNISISVE